VRTTARLKERKCESSFQREVINLKFKIGEKKILDFKKKV